MAKKIMSSSRWLVYFAVIAVGWLLLSHNYAWYQQPIGQVTAVKEMPATQRQTLKLTVMNGPVKGKQLNLDHEYSTSEGDRPRYHVGNELFLALSQGHYQLTGVKRDRWLWLLVSSFSALLFLSGRRQGRIMMLSILGNSLLFTGLLVAYIRFPQVPLVVLMLGGSVLSVSLTALAVSGWRRKSLLLILGTLGGTLSAWGIALIVLKVTGDRGLRYEEMGFLTRPFRPIYLSSLLIGTLGATTDIGITLLATLGELKAQEPQISVQALREAGQEVGKKILNPMVNILFFVYISEGVPLLLLYLANGWSYSNTISMTLSLELMRALVGALGITLTVPITVALASRGLGEVRQ